MNKLSDKEMQDLMDQKLSLTDHGSEADKKDLLAYQHLFDTLNKKPAEGLPFNFSAKVVSFIQAKIDRRIAFGWYVLFPVFLCIVFIGACFYLSYEDSSNAGFYLMLFLKYKWAFFFGSACFLLIEYLDRKLVRG